MAVGNLSIKYNDYDPEPSFVGVRTAAVTAANFDAMILLVSALYDAIAGANGICIGKRITSNFGNTYEILGPKVPADSPLAQRENKWKVNWQSAGGAKSGYITLPCADLTYLDENNRGYADMDNADVAAFVSALEALMVDEDDAAITVVDIQFVGRNT
jgi:hypothetical protein